ncbi:MAG: 50S ribosomal protein L4 [Chlamydiae bacterium]|nr:50S ribosomal protein L4 [Chlamydiota bacterium]
MAKLKKYNLAGKEVGTVDVDDRLTNAEANGQSIKDYIVALRNNLRQWSASTKNRSEVSHTTKKPRPQKGTGRARQGSLVTPQFRGGGVVFGPKPKFDQHVRINKKERRAAIRYLIGEKIRNNRMIVVENLEMSEPKTKTVSQFVNACNMKGRTLFLGEAKSQSIDVEGEEKSVSVKVDQHHNFLKSVRNIPKARFNVAQNISGYDVMVAGDIIITESALQQMTEWLS